MHVMLWCVSVEGFVRVCVIGKLHVHVVGFDPMTSSSTLPWQGEEVPFKLELTSYICLEDYEACKL